MTALPQIVSPERRIALYYLTLYTTLGSANAYAGIWFAAKGLTSGQIAAINAAPILVLLAVNMRVGRIADRAPDWRGLIVLSAVAGAILPTGLWAAAGFWPILVVWTLAQSAQGVAIPVIDAATLKLTTRRGTEFGPIRAWGTLGYLAALVVTGLAADRCGAGAFLPILVGFAILRAVAALGLPRFRQPRDPDAPGIAPARLAASLRPWFILPLLGSAIILSSHMALNAFQALLWARQGIGVGTVSLLIAFGALSETAMFFLWPRLRRRFAARHLLMLAGGTAALRWIAFSAAPGLVWLWPLQALHGITFGLTIMASLAFVNHHTSEEVAAEAQGFYFMLQQGTAILALLAFGALADRFGLATYGLSAVVALAGVAAIALSLRLRAPDA